VVVAGITAAAITACARCHGNEESLPASDRVPRLAGQSERYLVKALKDYASGRRDSGIMQPVATELDTATVESLARYYAGLRRPVPATHSVAEDASDRNGAGRRLAIEGDPQRAVPACNVCHGTNASPAYPRLAGQSAAYMSSQLALWRRGLRTATAEGQMMADIVRRLSAADADAVARYYSGLGSSAAAAGGTTGAARNE
jgi:cytochrome c553